MATEEHAFDRMSDQDLLDMLTKRRIDHPPDELRAADAEAKKRGGLRTLRERVDQARQGQLESPRPVRESQRRPAHEGTEISPVPAAARSREPDVHRPEHVVAGSLPWKHFKCPKCGGTGYRLDRVATSGSVLAAMFNLFNKRFFVVSCERCGYTEFYNEKLLKP